MKVIIAGGGTGGHVFPAISIAEEILNRDPGNEVLFVGTRSGLENKLVAQRGYEIKHISSGGIVGKGIFKRVSGVFSAAVGIVESVSVIRSFKPDVVLGVGGYVSGPVVLSASILRLPTAVCEQNSVPGVTNRILSKFAKKIFSTFEGCEKFFDKDKIVVTGNPVRKDILTYKGEKEQGRSFVCLVFGGSQGAKRLNSSVPEALSRSGISGLHVIHQTGENDLKDVQDFYNKNNISAEVLTFIDDMATAYARSDFVIGRAGAGTVAEITALGKPSLLIPFPYATHNHQLENAKALEASGAALLIEDKEATPENLAQALQVLKDKNKLEEMAVRSRALGKPGAAPHIVDEIYKLSGVNWCTER